MANNADEPDYASPPCFMHELDAGLRHVPPAPDPDVMRWRKVERERLIAVRLAIGADERLAFANVIASRLDELIGDAEGKVVSLYWPFRGEPDLRGWMKALEARGVKCALPVVVAKGAPLVFRHWDSNSRLERGVWNIPFPADGEEVLPDIVVAPVVGFDAGCWRLGYGGGFYDRTLAAMGRKPIVLGVGYSIQRIETIHPQPHDIAMEAVVTETGITSPR
ncbi:MAG TPA: 5-formyltetrahydrofolate cyclo-ligase [Rhizobiaceae bacterium]|nr:5-formyltetrahydrofolate cyclo-ligase [Rhizobiaceae bacterium]